MSYGAQLVTYWALTSAAILVLFYGVALVFESRMPGRRAHQVPLWKDQSRAFIPGVFFLVWTITCGVVAQREAQSPWQQWKNYDLLFWVLALLAAGTGFLYVVLQEDRRGPIFKRSATTLLLQEYRSVIAPFFLMKMALPMYLFNFTVHNSGVLVSGVLALCVWLGCVARDAMYYPSARQDPVLYKPIWRKTPR